MKSIKKNAAPAQDAAGALNNLFNSGNISSMLNNSQLPDKLMQYGQMAAGKVKNLSTTQKVIGGALLLLGAGYLSRRSNMSLAGLAGLAGKLKK